MTEDKTKDDTKPVGVYFVVVLMRRPREDLFKTYNEEEAKTFAAEERKKGRKVEIQRRAPRGTFKRPIYKKPTGRKREKKRTGRKKGKKKKSSSKSKRKPRIRVVSGGLPGLGKRR
jgi:hypothetical protein